MLPLTVNPDNTQTGHIEIRQLVIVPCHIGALEMEIQLRRQ
jgi:hypothetical protein